MNRDMFSHKLNALKQPYYIYIKQISNGFKTVRDPIITNLNQKATFKYFRIVLSNYCNDNIETNDPKIRQKVLS